MRLLISGLIVLSLSLVISTSASAAVSPDGLALLNNLSAFNDKMNGDATPEQEAKADKLVARFTNCADRVVKSKKVKRNLKNKKNKAAGGQVVMLAALTEVSVIIYQILGDDFRQEADSLIALNLTEAAYRDAAEGGASQMNMYATLGSSVKPGKSVGCEMMRTLLKSNKWYTKSFERKLVASIYGAFTLTKAQWDAMDKQSVVDERKTIAGYNYLEAQGADQSQLEIYASVLGGSEATSSSLEKSAVALMAAPVNSSLVNRNRVLSAVR